MNYFYTSLRALFFATILLTTSSIAKAQVEVSTGGPVTTYTTLNSAFDAINLGTHTGAITINITGNTNEPSTPTPLVASGQGSANYTSVSIRPVVTATISGVTNTGRGLIELNGADSVIINGEIVDGSLSRDLTFKNTASSSVGNCAVIRLIGNTINGLGCRNVSIKNTIIIGNVDPSSTSPTTSIAGIYAGDNSTNIGSITNTGNNYDHLVIDNNEVKKCYYAIAICGSATNTADSLRIINNLIGGNAANELNLYRGIYIANAPGALIGYNYIFNQIPLNNANIAAIEIGGSSVTVGDTIVGNKIESIYMQSISGWGAYGINLTTGNNHVIANNAISDIKTTYYSATSTSSNAFGIRITSGTGYKLYYNSINMYGDYDDQPSNTSTNASAAALLLTNTSITADIKNNIFNNKMTSSATSVTNQKFYSVWFPAGYNFSNATLDRNAYMVTNTTNHYVGKIGTNTSLGNYKTLSDWKVISTVNNTTNDGFSVPLSNENAPFASDFDLSIPSNTSTYLESGAIAIPALGSPNTDILLNTRPLTGINPNTSPDIGAYEFDGLAITEDIGIASILSPSTNKCFSVNDTVKIRLKNYSFYPIDFSVTPSTIIVDVTGPVNSSYTLAINSGTLSSGATLDTIINSNVNLSALGQYTITAYTILPADLIVSNDTTTITILNSPGIFTPTSKLICGGSPVTLNLTGNTANSIQWQEWDGVSTWVNSTQTGNTSSSYSPTPSANTIYRALVCGINPSNQDTITIINSAQPTARDTFRCGAGIATILSNNTTPLYWYTNANGGNALTTGNTYTVNVTQTDTFYVETITGGANMVVGATDSTITSSKSASSSIGYGLTFNVNTALMLNSVVVYPKTTGVLKFEIKQASTILYASSSIIITPTMLNVALTLPIYHYFNPGSGYSIQTASGNTAELLYNFSMPSGFYPLNHGAVTISGSINSPTSRYELFYNWNITTGCTSVRDTAIVVVNPAPIVAISTLSNDTVCAFTPVTLQATSSNTGYTYTWLPNTYLNSISGTSVVSTPSANISYTVSASDITSGCQNKATINLTTIALPSVVISTNNDTICDGTAAQLLAKVIPIQYTVGNGSIVNTTTSYPTPYGKFNEGSKHQFLILASELTATGLTAGSIENITFDVTNINNASNLKDYTIRMGHTTITNINAFQSGLTQVYTTTSYNPVNGLNVHSFSTPFTWDGTSNIVIETCYNNNGLGYTNNASVNQTITSYSSSVYYNADNNATVCTSTTTTSSKLQRPNIQLGKAPATSYAWSPSANLSSSIINNPVATPNLSTTYSVTVTDVTTTCQKKDTIKIQVNPSPNFNLGQDTVICGSSHLLNAGTGNAYLWNTGATTNTILTSSNGSYSVVATNGFGCTKQDVILLTFGILPVVTLGPDTAYCQGSTINLNAGYPGSNYLWNTGATTQILPVGTNGTYHVKVTTPLGCTDRDTVIVTSKTKPNVSLMFSTSTQLCTYDGARSLSEGFPTGGTYIGPGVSGSSFNPSSAGNGTHLIVYTYTGSNGCVNSAIDTLRVAPCTSIDELGTERNILLYPNPTTGYVSITIDAESSSQLEVEVFDVYGKLILNDTFTTAFGKNSYSFDLSGFANGVYYLKLSNGYSNKLLKQD